MTEKKDSERLNELLSVFGKDEYNELIEILYRDQIRYHNEQIAEQKELILIDYKISAERKYKEANIMSWGVSFWLVIIIVFLFLLAVRACS